MSVAELRLDPTALPLKPATPLPPVTHLKGRKGSRPFPGGPRGQNRDRGHRWGGNLCNNQNYPTVSGWPQEAASSRKSWLLGTVRGIQERDPGGSHHSPGLCHVEAARQPALPGSDIALDLPLVWEGGNLESGKKRTVSGSCLLMDQSFKQFATLISSTKPSGQSPALWLLSTF